MTQYLILYRRSTGDLLQFEDFGTDRAFAMSRRWEKEQAHKADPDVEVVLLTASSRESLVRTHARYFKNVPELAAALTAALPAIPEPGAPHISKAKVSTNRRKR
jgi:hypothetical protein